MGVHDEGQAPGHDQVLDPAFQLREVYRGFDQSLRGDFPSPLLSPDCFGGFIRIANLKFQGATQSFLNKHAAVLTDREAGLINGRFLVAQLGIGISGLVLELASLIPAKEFPEEPWHPLLTTLIAGNSLGFIQDIIELGDPFSFSMASAYLMPEKGDDGNLFFQGAVRNGKIAKPEVLDNFKLAPTDDGGLKIAPVDWEERIDELRGMIPNAPTKPTINCMAHLNELSPGVTYARLLYEIMLDYAHKKIYPGFNQQVFEIFRQR